MMQTSITLDRSEKLIVVESVQDVEPILEHNKMLRTMEQPSDWGRHIASIPNIVLTKWLQEEWAKGNTTIRLFGDEMDRLIARKIRDPEYAYLRTDAPSSQVQITGLPWL